MGRYFTLFFLFSFTLNFAQPKIVGLVPARNEAPIIAQCLQALSLYTDSIVYLDDASTDNSLEIVCALTEECNIEKIITKDVWFRDEPGDRNKLLQAGREIGGTHFLMLDADEMPSSNCLKGDFLRKKILALKPGERLRMNLIALWRSIDQYRHDNSVWTSNYFDFAFCDDGKSSYSSEFIHTWRTPHGLSGIVYKLTSFKHCILHFQFVNWRNLLVKQAWYRCLERIRLPNKKVSEINKRYAQSKNEKSLTLKNSPSYWFDRYAFFDSTVYDRPEGWREKQITGWFNEYGKDYFAGLDIWDIDWEKD